jgi:hypothetical protein
MYNATEEGYIRTIAEALEAYSGLTNDGAENATVSGYLKRIAEAVEALPIQGGAAGDAFPVGAATGAYYRRDDLLGRLFRKHSSGIWLSTEAEALTLATQEGVLPVSSTGSLWAANPHFGQFDIWVERFSLSSFNGAVPATNHFSGQLQKQNTAGTTNVGSAIATSGDTQNQLIGHAADIGAVIESTYSGIKVNYTENGSATSYLMASVVIRVIAT